MSKASKDSSSSRFGITGSRSLLRRFEEGVQAASKARLCSATCPAGVGCREGTTDPLMVTVSFSISCSDSKFASDSDSESPQICTSDAGDAELEDDGDSTLTGTGLDDAIALGRICGLGPVEGSEIEED